MSTILIKLGICSSTVMESELAVKIQKPVAI